MRVHPTIFLCAAALIPQLAQSNAPSGSQQLGAVMAVVEFCSRVDPKDAGHIRQQVKALLGEDIKDHFEGARRSPEYEDAHRAIEAVLDELPLRDAVQACQAI